MILIGEMRDEETVATALSAAETGHLVLSNLHTLDAPETINRSIDFFPPHMHNQARAMLAGTLKGVISQRLVRTADGRGRVATCEILRTTGRVRDMIMNPAETGRLTEVISEGDYYGMQTFDQASSTTSGRTGSPWTRHWRPPRARTTSSCSSRRTGGARRRSSRSARARDPAWRGLTSPADARALDSSPPRRKSATGTLQTDREGPDMQSSLAEFQETTSQEAFTLQNSKLLKVRLEEVTIQAKLGSMVAYQGDVRFEHAGTGGLSRFMKKAVTGEGTQLMKMQGTGEVFLADHAQDVHLIYLENDRVTCNGANVLAFDAGIDWDITKVEGGMAGAMAGGLYNTSLGGTGWVAVISDGPPVLLNTGAAPTFCDPQAAITWSSGVQTQVKTDVNLKSFIGRGSGETIQMGFVGEGWVLVQPSEGQVAGAVPAGGGTGSGLLKNLGG